MTISPAITPAAATGQQPDTLSAQIRLELLRLSRNAIAGVQTRDVQVSGAGIERVRAIARQLAARGTLHEVRLSYRVVHYFADAGHARAFQARRSAVQRIVPLRASYGEFAPAAAVDTSRATVTVQPGPAATLAAAGTPTDRPMVYRPGSRDHEQWPSRMGNRLVWRDGRMQEAAA